VFKTWQQIKILPSNSNASNSSAKPIKSDNALIGRNEKKIAANLNSKLPLTKTFQNHWNQYDKERDIG
jgi:hypothetical protein